MAFLLLSFVAGLLTVLAPCTLSILPILLSSSVETEQAQRLKPLRIALALAGSIFVFTLLLKVILAQADLPYQLITIISGGIIFMYGLFLLFPTLWERMGEYLHLHASDKLVSKSRKRGGVLGDILLGAALGPVFTTCSPTYLLILGTVLPTDLGSGTLYLAAYCLGLALVLLAIGYGGRALASRFRFAANPHGVFKRILAVLLIIVGLAIMTGFDKRVEQFVLERGYLGPIGIEDTVKSHLQIGL